MRNLVEHPITMDEVKAVIEAAYKEASKKELCGDLAPGILRIIRGLISQRFTEDDFRI